MLFTLRSLTFYLCTAVVFELVDAIAVEVLLSKILAKINPRIIAAANVITDPTIDNFKVIKNRIVTVNMVMMETEFQRTRSLTFSNNAFDGRSPVSSLAAVKIAFNRLRLMIGPINVIITNAAREKSTHPFPHPHVEITRYKPGNKIKMTLKGSNPSSFTANADQFRIPSVFVE